MIKALQESRVIVCVGSGGVGKTTFAASLGFIAAQQGRRVLVLTIDPSQRLKTTLGLQDDGAVSTLHHPQITTGQLSAAVVDAKKTFDNFVKRAAQSDSSAEKILNNKLYQQLSTNLSSSQEFTALECLYANFISDQYDLIILDTPPTKHAIDFLQAPQKLAGLFNENIAKWFRATPEKIPFFSRFLQAGTMQVLKILQTLTGSEFTTELADFFQNIQSWQSKLEERVIATQRLLVSPTTYFCLVTSFDQAKLKECTYFAKEIRKGGYKIAAIVINRAFPQWLIPLGSTALPSTPLAKKYLQLAEYYQQRDLYYRQFAQDTPIFRIPEFTHDIANLDQIAEMSAVIKNEFSKDNDVQKGQR